MTSQLGRARWPLTALIQVSFQWKNPDFLLKNPGFLLKTVDFMIKQTRAATSRGRIALGR